MTTTDGGAMGAAAAVDFLKQLMEAGVGISYVVAPRSDSKISNAEIVRIHAEEGVTRKDIGNVKRSLYPSQTQINSLTKVFADEVTKHLVKIGKTYKSRQIAGYAEQELSAGQYGPVQQVAVFETLTKVHTEEKQVKQAGASALRKVAIIYHDNMEENLIKQRNSDGSPMQAVKDSYALRRLAKHSVEPSAIFQATGQLENAFENGKYVLYYDPAKIQNIKKAFGLNF